MFALTPVAKLSPLPERRSSIRFPLELKVTYKSVELQPKVASEGKSVNVSSNGLLFCSDHLPQVGESIEVCLEWPAKIDGKCPLKLVVRGKVVRIYGQQAAVKLSRYEFRTLGRLSGALLSRASVA